MATSKALKSTLEALPDDETRKNYKDLAAKNLVEAVKCRGMELFEVPHFDPWMTRCTRFAPGHVLISLRHPETRAIDCGIELNFRDPDRLHCFYSMMFKLAGPVTGLIYGAPFALAVILAGVLEEATYLNVDYFLLQKKSKKEIRSRAKPVRLKGGNDKQRAMSARLYIDSLVEAEI